MFILRRITEKKLEVNTCLDVFYTLILKEKNKDDFNDRVKLWSKEDLLGIYGLVCVDDRELIMPLHEESSYFIMTDQGQTFANISKKI